jgi:hypothetical protein
MSLLDPSNPKKACQIQRSYEATTSKIIVASRPDVIIEKTQLQRFVGSLNYIVDF